MAEQEGRDRKWSILDQVKELPDSAQEYALQRLCDGDEELLEEVRSLLLEPSRSFLDKPAWDVRQEQEAAVDDQPPPGGDATEDLGGTVLDGKYILREFIGAGSMGAVYRGQHLQLGKDVAIKVLHAATNSEELLEAMRHEASTAAAVEHENIVPVHDVGVHDKRAFMVMDWIEGVDLERWLKARAGLGRAAAATREQLRAFVESELRRPCTGALWSRPYWEIVAHIVACMARAVSVAHSQHVVHRDIAPKNVMLTAEGKPYLVDFGVAALASDGQTETDRGEVAGTLPYMAPEQLESAHRSRQTSVDVYGLGATLYHLLVGRPPFEGGKLEIFTKIRSQLPPGVRELQPDVPRDLEAICFGAMEKRPADRYPDADLLADDLEAFVERRPVRVRPPGPVGRAVRWCQRRPALAVTTAALAALLTVSSILGVLAYEEYRVRQLDSDHAAFARSFARLPSNVTLGADARYASPPIVPLSDQDLGETWDMLIDLKPDQPLLLWYRANWHSQLGRLAEAQRDLDVLRSRGASTQLFEAIAAKLVSEAAIERNQLIPPGDLPDPGSAFDRCLKAYVALRWREPMVAWLELTTAIDEQPDQWLWRDLRALAGMDTGFTEITASDVGRVASLLGVQTCRTLHVRAFLNKQANLDEAKKLWQQCIELGGDQHEPLQSLAAAALATADEKEDELARAKTFLSRALDQRPSSRVFVTLSECQEDATQKEQVLVEARKLQLSSGLPLGSEPLLDLDLQLVHLYVQQNERFADGERLLDQLLQDETREPLMQELEALSAALQAARGEITWEEAIELQVGDLAAHFDVERKPSASILHNLAQCLSQVEQPDLELLADLQRVVRLLSQYAAVD